MSKNFKFLLISIGIYFLILADSFAPTYPAWWDSKEILSDATPNNYGIANQGQAKWFAQQGIEYLDEKLAAVGGAGFTLDDLLIPDTPTAHYSALNIGQLKNIASKFYDRLHEVGYPLPATSHPNG